MPSIDLPEAAVEAFESMSAGQLTEWLSEFRPGMTVVDSQPVSEAYDAVLSGIDQLDLEDKESVRSLVQESDEIGRALRGAAYRVLTSDLEETAQEAVLDVLSKVGDQFGVQIERDQAEEEQEASDEAEPSEDVTKLEAKVRRLENEQAATEALADVDAPIRDQVRTKVMERIDSFEDTDEVREAVEETAQDFKRASESYIKSRPEFDNVNETRATEEDGEYRSRFYRQPEPARSGEGA